MAAAPQPFAVRRSRALAFGAFVLLEIATLAFVFRGGVTGRRLLAPLDLAPRLLPHYHYAGPAGDEESNHYFYDQLVYDLPLQRTIHQALRRGEMPWWDPLTLSGRPLLADAHVNGTDPWRILCFLLLPFIPAYNWTHILHFITAGAGAWRLLRRLGVDEPTAQGLALAWQWSGCLVLKFGYPWLPASFAWYPWLWLALEHAWGTSRPAARWGAPLACAAIFFSGNLQSHAYLALFLAAWSVGTGGADPRRLRRALALAGLAGALGAALAAPVLVNELELFAVNVREVSAPAAMHGKPWLAPWLTLAGMVHPWGLGTFRSLDASKWGGIGLGSAGFNLFAGVLTLGGALGWMRFASVVEDQRRAGRIAAWLVAAYFLVLATPLLGWLYTRTAGLGCLGLVVLGGLGLQRLREQTMPLRGVGRGALVLGAALAIGVNGTAWILWPRLSRQIHARVEREAAQSPLGALPELRQAQMDRWPAETSFENPEVALAVAGWMAMGALCLKPGWRARSSSWAAAMALNVAPLVLFAARCIPHGDLAQWRALERGGDEQRAAAAAAGAAQGRLWEPGAAMRLRLFPGAMSHLAGISTIQGYAALRPPNPADLPEPVRSAELAKLGVRAGSAAPVAGVGADAYAARFRWISGGAETPKVTAMGLNAVRLDFGRPQAGVLLWADAWYRGWTAIADGVRVPLEPAPPCFSQLTLAQPTRSVVLQYRPRWLAGATAVSAAGAVGLAWVAASGRLRRSAELP